MLSRHGFLVLLLILATGVALSLSSASGVFASGAGDAAKLSAGATLLQQGGEADLADALAKPAQDPERTSNPAAGPLLLPVFEGQLRVQIVDGESGEPVAGAEVAAEGSKFRPDQLSLQEQRDYERTIDDFLRFQRWGQRAVSDSEGFVVLEIDADRGSVNVFAQKDTRFGKLWVQAHVDNRLKLWPDLTVAARVVDAAGHGLPDVPLGITAEWLIPGAASGDRYCSVLAYTDGDGNAQLRHFRQLQEDWRPKKPKDLRLFVSAPGLTAVHAPISPQCPAGEPVVLTIPAYGAIRLALVDRNNQPVADSLSPSIALAVANLEAVRAWDDARSGEQMIGGKAEFPYVGLGLTFLANSWFAGINIDREFLGPRGHKEAVEATLSLAGQKTAHLRGRLIDAGASPYSQIDIIAIADGNSEPFLWLRTNLQGQFDWLGSGDHLDEVRRLVFVARDDLGGPIATSAPIVLPADILEVDLGDLVMRVPKPVARGHVTALVSPLPKHRLNVQVWQPGDGANAGAWNFSSAFGVSQGKDGAFVVATTSEGSIGGPMRLLVTCDDAEPVTPFEFANGNEQIKIELSPAAKLTARILLDTNVILDSNISGQLVGMGSEQASFGMVQDTGTQLEFNGLRPGDYQLGIKLRDQVIETIAGLRLAPGAPADPRVDPIDLRGRLHPMQVRLVDALGQVADHYGTLYLRDQSAGGFVSAAYLEHGVVNFINLSANVELVVIGDDFRPLHWQGPTGLVDLRIEMPLPVHIEFRGLPELSPQASLLCASKLLGRSPFSAKHGLALPTADEDVSPLVGGIVSRTCLEAGTYTVVLQCQIRDGAAEELFVTTCEISPAHSSVSIMVPAEQAQRIAVRLNQK